mmetsp:Transcript_64629/g.185914  ORF Transcript_64629/g.185914 Transcript_64629/m.185914 type:complete len:407 (-) Transcript_64629:152-1372(-)
MALMLSGESQHLSYAPLSHGQTLSICHHLESLIQELQGQSVELRRDLDHAKGTIEAMRQSCGSTDAAVQGLQEGLHNTNDAVGTLKKDAKRTSEKLGKVAAGMESNRELVVQQREAMKINSAELQGQRRDFDLLVVRVNQLQQVIEKSLATSTDELWTEVKQAQLIIKNLQGESERTKAALQEQREKLRSTNGNLQALSDREQRLEAFTSSLEKRTGETVVALKATRAELGEAGTGLAQLSEEHKHTRSLLAGSADVIKKNGLSLRKLHENLDSNNTKLSQAGDTLQRTSAGLQSTKEAHDKTSSQLRSLAEAHEMLYNSHSTMKSNYEHTHASLQSVKENLKMTNALVLPNLHLDTPRSPGNQPWGSTHSTTFGTTRPTSSRGSRKRDSPPSTNSPMNSTMLAAS